MKGRHVAILMAVILVAVLVAYALLHQRAPDEPPTKIQSSSLAMSRVESGA